MKEQPVVALIGNPNTGKTTVFNALCGARQRTGNYPGVTVEKKSGTVIAGDLRFELIDLPGLYSLKAISPDEELASDAIMGRVQGQSAPDVIVYVLDATNLKRNLLVFAQLAEVGKPVVVALTMTDLLTENGIDLDIRGLEKSLGVPVVPVVARDAAGIEELKTAVQNALRSPRVPSVKMDLPAKLEKAVSVLNDRLKEFIPISRLEARHAILHPDDPILLELQGRSEALAAIEKARKDAGPVDPGIVTEKRFSWAEGVAGAVEKRQVSGQTTRTEKIDRVLTHRVFGLAAFVGVMYLTFQSIYSWAGPLVDAINAGFEALGSAASDSLASTPMLGSLVSDGIIAGVGSVLVFLPQIIILFLFLAVLEDSGYLARAAFLMDKLLAWSGLNGRAFIPMLSSFACAVPGVMAARVIPDARARMATILVSPLMSCSARLPVYLLLIGAFIEPRFGAGWAAFTLFAMHALGLLVALPVAWLLNRGILKTPPVPFIMEMPPYRMPHLRNVLFRVFEAAKRFVVRAGTVIFALSIVIWALTYFPRPESIQQASDGKAQLLIAQGERAGAMSEEQKSQILNSARAEADALYLEQSYLGRAGKTIQPVFAPLGFDWKITVGVLAAFPAREVIISALGIIYSVGDADDEESSGLKQQMAREVRQDGSPLFTPLLAVTLMVFFALCCQCMSTVATVQKELGSWKLAVFMFTYMTALAYAAGLLVYQVGRWAGLG